MLGSACRPARRSQRARHPGEMTQPEPAFSARHDRRESARRRIRRPDAMRGFAQPGHRQDHQQPWLPVWPPVSSLTILPRSQQASGLQKQWAQQGSNLRPLACKASALPLSYAPVPPSSISQDPGSDPAQRTCRAGQRGSRCLCRSTWQLAGVAWPDFRPVEQLRRSHRHAEPGVKAPGAPIGVVSRPLHEAAFVLGRDLAQAVH